MAVGEKNLQLFSFSRLLVPYQPCLIEHLYTLFLCSELRQLLQIISCVALCCTSLSTNGCVFVRPCLLCSTDVFRIYQITTCIVIVKGFCLCLVHSPWSRFPSLGFMSRLDTYTNTVRFVQCATTTCLFVLGACTTRHVVRFGITVRATISLRISNCSCNPLYITPVLRLLNFSFALLKGGRQLHDTVVFLECSITRLRRCQLFRSHYIIWCSRMMRQTCAAITSRKCEQWWWCFHHHRVRLSHPSSPPVL